MYNFFTTSFQQIAEVFVYTIIFSGSKLVWKKKIKRHCNLMCAWRFYWKKCKKIVSGNAVLQNEINKGTKVFNWLALTDIADDLVSQLLKFTEATTLANVSKIMQADVLN